MIRRTAPILFAVVVILLVMSPIFRGQRYAFRDVSHFYLPLYDYVGERTRGEWLPLWNPLDQMGMPLVGESTTAVLYPVRDLIYRLPLESEAALNVYLLAHVILAAITSAWLARRIGCCSVGVAAAAFVYPLSGCVFSLCCNPPFLVGAAWLPLALGALVCADRDRFLTRVQVASFSLAMMVLGGDPQTALHVTMVACVWLTIGGLKGCGAKSVGSSYKVRPSAGCFGIDCGRIVEFADCRLDGLECTE